MTVAIVGGTSQVATELSLLFRERGVEVHPIVRSRIGASFYERHDVAYRIADVTDPSEASDALADADVVVIAAFARQYARGFAPRRARKTNERIIESVVCASPPDATIVYFSTIAAFGNEVGFSDWDAYGREKRHAETVLAEAAEAYGREEYAFRMGPVYGVNQNKTGYLCRQIATHWSDGALDVGVASDRPSNALHTVTLMDAIEMVSERTFDADWFTLVNEPRWTWRNVIDYYVPDGTTLRFHPPAEDSLVGSALRFGKWAVESRERSLRALSVYLPPRLNQRIFNEYVRRNVANDLTELTAAGELVLSQFDEEPAPGPRLEGLRPTQNLLNLEHKIEPAFTTEYETSTPEEQRTAT